jgi:3-methylcrotonyl-CoA carboxylase alpha subunit
MKSRLRIEQELVEIEFIQGDLPQTGEAVIAENRYRLAYQPVSANQLQMLVNGKPVKAFIARGIDEKEIFIEGRVYRVTEGNQGKGRKRRAAGPSETQGEVTPPMPSVVVRILVKEGDWVAKDQGLVVVSAMKMETTLKAPHEGRVVKINTALQAKVMPGDKLVEIREGTAHEQ